MIGSDRFTGDRLDCKTSDTVAVSDRALAKRLAEELSSPWPCGMIEPTRIGWESPQIGLVRPVY